MSYKIVASSSSSSNQVVMSAGSRPLLISVIGPAAGETAFFINNQRIAVGTDETFNLDKNSLPDCIGEQWFVTFGENDTLPSRWAVAWDTPEARPR